MRYFSLLLIFPAQAASADVDIGRWLSSLLLVLLLVVVLAAVAKRLRAQSQFGSQRVVDSIALGMRERIVVVELESVFYVLGVTAHNITLLDKRDSWPQKSAPAVADLLKKWTSKREDSASNP